MWATRVPCPVTSQCCLLRCTLPEVKLIQRADILSSLKAFISTHSSASLLWKHWYLIITSGHDCGVIMVHLCNRFKLLVEVGRQNSVIHTVACNSVICFLDLFQTAGEVANLTEKDDNVHTLLVLFGFTVSTCLWGDFTAAWLWIAAWSPPCGPLALRRYFWRSGWCVGLGHGTL